MPEKLRLSEKAEKVKLVLDFLNDVRHSVGRQHKAGGNHRYVASVCSPHISLRPFLILRSEY